MKLFPVAVLLVLPVVAHLASGKKLRWCTLSPLEQKKCAELSKALLSTLPPVSSSTLKRVSCILAHNTYDCINKIRENKADAVSLDAGDVYSAVKLYGLTVVAKEIYLEGSCVFAVAVAKRGMLDLQRLKGVRSCHNGARWTSGWSIPMGFLLARSDLMWVSDQPLSQAISGYFNASCIPGIGATYPKLCALCQGPKSYIWDKNHFCEASRREPFYGSEGAFRCLTLGLADVAFVDHLTVMSATELEREEYELLCPDGSAAPLTAYSTCNLGNGPGRAIVTRRNLQKIVKKFLKVIQVFPGLPPVYIIALVRKANHQVNRYTLRGKRSCHSHVYSPGGWLLLSQYTVGAPENGSSSCNLTSAYQNFFWKGCMPGASGNLCKVCIGQEGRGKGSSRCAANHHERYYGNLGALRCLLGDPAGRSFGDVALLEHHNLLQNIDYLNSSGWATGYTPRDFELLCPDGSRAAITAWRTCNLGCVPPSVVVTRPVTVTKVHDFLAKSQGRHLERGRR
ncbi:saxiphilin-like [Protobothrops mucrosquamatus]|uniref:saxiphilin-like n=1 Tax=Protobothrops mucrosquamatus TaxID=103944 RepID=UPI0010FB34A7|nr:saxiphilin-like [Protobothrops mucrosquamatus]